MFVLLLSYLLATPALSAELKLIPLIDVREEYNSNILFDSTDEEEINDSITTLSPALRLTGRTERLDSALQSGIHEIRYRDYDEFDATDQDHFGSVSYRFTERWRGSADARYVKDSRSDRDIDFTGRTLGTTERKRSHFGGSTDFALTEKAGIGLSYAWDRDRFEDPDEDDSTVQDASMRLTYDLSGWLPGTVAQIEGGYALYDYTNTRVVDLSVTAGAMTRFSETLSLTAFIGRSRTRTRYEFTYLFWELDETSVNSGTIGQVALSYNGEKTGMNLALIRDIRALSGDQGVVRRTSVQAGLRYRFTYELEGSVSAEYFLNSANQGELASEDIDERTVRVQPRLIYRFTPDLFLESSYRYTRLEDRETDLDYAQSLAYLRLVWQYPVPR